MDPIQNTQVSPEPNQNITSVVSVEKGKKFPTFVIILLTILMLVGFGVAGYLYFNPDVIEKCNEKCEETQNDTTSPINQNNSEDGIELPTVKEEYVFSYNSECNVGVSYPGQSIRYTEGNASRTWRVANTLGEESKVDYDKGFTNKLRRHFQVYLHYDLEASEYNPGSVRIMCGKNVDDWDVDELSTAYLTYVDGVEKSYKSSQDLGDVSGFYYTATDSGLVDVWGVKVKKYHLKGNFFMGSEEYDVYLYATKDHIYYIISDTDSTDSKIKKDLDTIYKSIVFFD